MNGLTSGELARIVEGQLVLGTMPPLGGRYEPVRGIVIDSRQAGPGDIYWDLPGRHRAQLTGCWPEEALARGAVGVVVERRHIEPWSGSFSVQVADAVEALERLAVWGRARLRGQRIAVLEDNGGTLASRIAAAAGGASAAAVGSWVEWTLQVLGRQRRSARHVFRLSPNSFAELLKILDLCRPQLVVIYSPHNHELQTTLARREAALQLAAVLAETRRVVVVGGGMVIPEMLVRQVHVVQLDGNELKGNLEVPPLVSGLRESDTTLPPGLKRFAC